MSKTVLIVDDDPIVAESIAEVLSQEDYLTATAGDGNEALDLLDQRLTPAAAPPGPDS